MEFYAKIAGVTFDNRQRLIWRLKREGKLEEGTELILNREPNNPYDRNAVAVLTVDGDHLGYLPKDTVACKLAPKMDNGERYVAYVTAVTGGDVGNAFGINIKIQSFDEDNIYKEKEVEGMYSKRIYNNFKTALENAEFRFKENTEKGLISVPSIGIDSSIESISLLIKVREDDSILHAVYDNFKVASSNLNKVAELLMRISENYIFPQFILSYDNQNIISQYRPLFDDDNVDCDLTQVAIGNILLPMQKYANAILSVSLGLRSPKDAFEEAEKDY